MQTAVERWQELNLARARQMDAAYALIGRSSGDFWDRRARTFHRTTRESASLDPFFLFVRDRLQPGDRVLDVGAGAGRFSLALAPQASRVIAVEPNSAMLGYLRQEIAASASRNIEVVQANWEDAPADLRAEAVICSHVLYPIRDILPFLQKMQQASTRACYLYHRVTHIDSITAPLWRHFHHDERIFPPGAIHLLDVLYEQGIYANLQIVHAPFAFTFPSIQEAEDEQLEQLILADNPATRAELREQLTGWLSEQPDQSWRSQPVDLAVGIIWWEKGGE